VLAGPVGSRFLAAYGADVLRIDPPEWDEPGVVPEVTLGKRCAGLDLRDSADRKIFEELLARADVFLHGYRADALARLGYDDEALRKHNPNLIDVSLNAYGWAGEWMNRRGFDSLVQMSSGIADFGMQQSESPRPKPLPVQALDHATGYLLAASVLAGLLRREKGEASSAKLSLARVAHLLGTTRRSEFGSDFALAGEEEIDPRTEDTAWGPAKRVRWPLEVEGIQAAWPYPAGRLRSARPEW
jgi:crotonobetainyl-CoA:carnitine CoA-transferase CaiB-like acyl-CoA transferase